MLFDLDFGYDLVSLCITTLISQLVKLWPAN